MFYDERVLPICSSTPVYVHIGAVFARLAPAAARARFVSGDFIDLWTHYIYTLLADPEMPMWTGPVTTLSR